VLSYSGYAYAEVFWYMKQDSWITVYVHAYDFFGGITKILVPYNLKAEVTKNRTELIINKTYQDLIEHYCIAVIPTRVRSPKDKPSVEGAVGNMSTFIFIAIRNQNFFSLKELNQTVKERLHAFNNKTFKRNQVEERHYLQMNESF
jgi:transposase